MRILYFVGGVLVEVVAEGVEVLSFPGVAVVVADRGTMKMGGLCWKIGGGHSTLFTLYTIELLCCVA